MKILTLRLYVRNLVILDGFFLGCLILQFTLHSRALYSVHPSGTREHCRKILSRVLQDPEKAQMGDLYAIVSGPRLCSQTEHGRTTHRY
jgi:hypothetical protein